VILKGKVAFSAPAGEVRTVPAGSYADREVPL
jgi:hypothetical protein